MKHILFSTIAIGLILTASTLGGFNQVRAAIVQRRANLLRVDDADKTQKRSDDPDFGHPRPTWLAAAIRVPDHLVHGDVQKGHHVDLTASIPFDGLPDKGKKKTIFADLEVLDISETSASNNEKTKPLRRFILRVTREQALCLKVITDTTAVEVFRHPPENASDALSATQRRELEEKIRACDKSIQKLNETFKAGKCGAEELLEMIHDRVDAKNKFATGQPDAVRNAVVEALKAVEMIQELIKERRKVGILETDTDRLLIDLARANYYMRLLPKEDPSK